MELEVYKKSDFYEDYIDSQKEYYERENADAYFAERLAEKDKEIARLNAQSEMHEKEIEFMHSNCKWHAGDGCSRLHGELMAATSEIAELNDDVTYWKKVAKKNMDDNVTMARERAKAFESERHHKYKRCLAMAYVEWLKQMILSSFSDSILYRRAVRRERKWKEMAEKFKEEK